MLIGCPTALPPRLSGNCSLWASGFSILKSVQASDCEGSRPFTLVLPAASLRSDYSDGRSEQGEGPGKADPGPREAGDAGVFYSHYQLRWSYFFQFPSFLPELTPIYISTQRQQAMSEIYLWVWRQSHFATFAFSNYSKDISLQFLMLLI